MKIKIITLLGLIVLLVSCGSQKDMLYSSNTENTDLLWLNDSALARQKLLQDKDLIHTILHSNIDTSIHTLSTKTKVYAQIKSEDKNGKKISFSMETRILRDSIFWCSMTYFGIEIMRLKATKQYFLVKIIGDNHATPLHQLLERQYDSALSHIEQRATQKKQEVSMQIGDLEKMKMMLDYIKNNQQEILMFMNLAFMGNFPFLKNIPDSIWYNPISTQYIFPFYVQKGKATALFHKNKDSYLMDKFFMRQGKMYFGIHYLEYKPQANGYFLPHQFIAFNDMADANNKHQYFELRFENNRVNVNSALEYPMPPMR